MESKNEPGVHRVKLSSILEKGRSEWEMFE